MANKISGRLIHVLYCRGVYLLDVDVLGDKFKSVTLHNGFKEGENVVLHFKESEISLAKKIDKDYISISNVHEATVKTFDKGEILTTVTILYKENELLSLITTNSFEKLEISPGQKLLWLAKALSVEVLRE